MTKPQLVKIEALFYVLQQVIKRSCAYFDTAPLQLEDDALLVCLYPFGRESFFVELDLLLGRLRYIYVEGGRKSADAKTNNIYEVNIKYSSQAN